MQEADAAPPAPGWLAIAQSDREKPPPETRSAGASRGGALLHHGGVVARIGKRVTMLVAGRMIGQARPGRTHRRTRRRSPPISLILPEAERKARLLIVDGVQEQTADPDVGDKHTIFFIKVP